MAIKYRLDSLVIIFTRQIKTRRNLNLVQQPRAVAVAFGKFLQSLKPGWLLYKGRVGGDNAITYVNRLQGEYLPRVATGAFLFEGVQIQFF